MRWVMKERLALVLGVLIFVSCNASSSIEARTGAQVADDHLVTVIGATVEYDRASRILTATLPVTIRNDRAQSVFFSDCNVFVERAADTGWRGVWQRVCNLGQGNPVLEIPSGQHHAFTLRIVGRLGDGNLEYWTEPVSGQYRVRVLLADRRGQNLTDADQLSAPFELRSP